MAEDGWAGGVLKVIKGDESHGDRDKNAGLVQQPAASWPVPTQRPGDEWALASPVAPSILSPASLGLDTAGAGATGESAVARVENTENEFQCVDEGSHLGEEPGRKRYKCSYCGQEKKGHSCAQGKRQKNEFLQGNFAGTAVYTNMPAMPNFIPAGNQRIVLISKLRRRIAQRLGEMGEGQEPAPSPLDLMAIQGATLPMGSPLPMYPPTGIPMHPMQGVNAGMFFAMAPRAEREFVMPSSSALGQGGFW